MVGIWIRVVLVSLPPMLITLMASVPALQPTPKLVRGEVTRTTVCLGRCAEVIQVAGVRMGCRVDLLGVPYDCGSDRLLSRLTAPGEATASYATLPSLAGLVGLARTEGTLVRLERGGAKVYARSVPQQLWAALYGGWVFHAIYWPIAGLVVWRWPGSRLARRVTGRHLQKEKDRA